MKRYNVTDHAIKRCVERLNKTAGNAKAHLNDLMQTAYFNGNVPHPSGKIHKVYDHVKSRTRLIVSEDDFIITVYKFPKLPEVESPKPILSEVPTFLRDKVTQVVQRELARFESKERKVERRNSLSKAELEIEVAELKLRLLRARSESKKMALQARLEAVQIRIDELDNEINEVKREKTAVAKGVAAYL